MKTLHIVPGTSEISNGMMTVARMIVNEKEDAEIIDLCAVGASDIGNADEIWIHGMWLPKEWQVCRAALNTGKRLVRMTHGSLSPIYLKHQSPFKKRLVAPIERYFLRKADKVIATCQAEADWIRAYEPRVKFIDVIDLKHFFNFSSVPCSPFPVSHSLHILYLGRRHPLKGLKYLETAVRQIQEAKCSACSTWLNKIELKVVSNAFGEEKERVWEWCDVLILPTLSDNFGLVIAEALEHGKRVITTDGAPAWGDGNTYGGRLICLCGYRDGTCEQRGQLLKSAIECLICQH